MFNRYTIIGSLLLVFFLALFSYHKHEVRIAVKETVAQIEMQSNKENFRLKERSLDSQIALQQKADDIQKEKDAKIKTLTGRVAALTRSLSDHPNRPEASGISVNPGTQESSGYVAADRLYRNDAEVAIWFATRTERLKIELQTCYKSYDEAKQMLDDFKRNNSK